MTTNTLNELKPTAYMYDDGFDHALLRPVLKYDRVTDLEAHWKEIKLYDEQTMSDLLDRVSDLKAEVAAEKERANYAWRNTQAIDKSRQEEMAKRDEAHNLFLAAIRDLARINERLGLDPDDGGADPILDAIDDLVEQRDALRTAIMQADETKTPPSLAYTVGINVDLWRGIVATIAAGEKGE